MVRTGLKEEDLRKCSINELNKLKAEIEEDLEDLEETLRSLGNSEPGVSASINNLELAGPHEDGRIIFVPLSDSIYVPGKLKDGKTVLVDIGCGYYVRKEINEAKEYFQQKLIQLQKEKRIVILSMAERSESNLAVMNVIREKLHELFLDQEPRRANKRKM